MNSSNIGFWILIVLVLYFVYGKFFQNKKNNSNIKCIDIEEKFHEDEANHFVIEDNEYRFTEMFLEENKIYIYDRTQDYLSEFNKIYEYKIENGEILIKLLEFKVEQAGEDDYYEVQDGVVLESDIINRYKHIDERIGNFFPQEEKIENLKKQCNRNTELSYEVRYFIFSRNIKKLGTEEVKRILRSELEQIKLCMLKLNALCNEYDAELNYSNGNPWFALNGKNSENKKIIGEFLEKLDLIIKDMEFNRSDIGDFEKRMTTLKLYLSNL